jgi:hypothetical protein
MIRRAILVGVMIALGLGTAACSGGGSAAASPSYVNGHKWGEDSATAYDDTLQSTAIFGGSRAKAVANTCNETWGLELAAHNPGFHRLEWQQGCVAGLKNLINRSQQG